MSMNTVGRPTRPEGAAGPAGFASLTGGRGLLQDEPLIFELGGWDKTGVDLPEPGPTRRTSPASSARTCRCRASPSPRPCATMCG